MKHTYSLEQIDGTDQWKLYLGRHEPITAGEFTTIGHGMWLCTLSDFDANGARTRADIIKALNERTP